MAEKTITCYAHSVGSTDRGGDAFVMVFNCGAHVHRTYDEAAACSSEATR